MRKTRQRHVVREKARIVKYGTRGFSRNIWLSTAATVVMAFTLIVLFATVLASVVLTNTAEMMKDKIDITVYLKPGTSEETLTELTQTISKDPNIKEVTTSTSEEEYAKLLKDYADSDVLMGVLNDDDMASLMVDETQAVMRVKVYDVDNLDSVKELVATDDLFVKYVDKDRAPTYDVKEAEIATITSWARIARTGGIVLGAVFLIVSVLIIFSTIRMAIFSRREEIYMMKLVGADKSFIRGPFLIEAEICGAIAGVVAATLSYAWFELLTPKLGEYGIDISSIKTIMSSNQLVLVYAAFILIGILIGRISARLAVSRYLNKA